MVSKDLLNSVTISIATRDRSDVLNATLQRLYEFGLGSIDLIVCDDGSMPVINPPALSLFPKGRLLRNDLSQGQAAARNWIARECKTPYLLQLDDDSYPIYGELNEVVALFERFADCAAIALALDEPSRGRRTRGFTAGEYPPSVSSFVGCGCVLRVADFLSLGGYAEWLSATCEEDELCLRLAASGKTVIYYNNFRIQHEVSLRGRDEEAILFRSYRNWILVWWVHAPTGVLVQRIGGLYLRAIIALLSGKGAAALYGCFAAVMPWRIARRTKLSLSVYSAFILKPHHLAFFVSIPDNGLNIPIASGTQPKEVFCRNENLVSVVIPLFNRSRVIRQCVQSVFNQTHRPIEVILVDDGSTDDSQAVLQQIATEFNGHKDAGFEIRVFRQENAGAPSARNNGIRNSRGEWIQFLDSDDILLPEKIASALRLAEKTDAEIVYSRAQFLARDGRVLQRYWGRKLTLDWRDYFEFSWQTMCAFYSRNAIECIGEWNESLSISQDWEYCIRAVSSGISIHFDETVNALYMSEGTGRIGSDASIKKHQGREIALWAVYEHLRARSMLCRSLRNRFRNRLIHVLLCYRALGARKNAIGLAMRIGQVKLLPRSVAALLPLIVRPVLARLIVSQFEKNKKTTSMLT